MTGGLRVNMECRIARMEIFFESQLFGYSIEWQNAKFIWKVIFLAVHGNYNVLIHVLLTLCMLGNFSCFCCHLLTFFKNIFCKIFSKEHYQCQMVCIQIRTDIMSVLIWVKAVFKGHQRRQQNSPLARKELRLTFHC